MVGALELWFQNSSLAGSADPSIKKAHRPPCILPCSPSSPLTIPLHIILPEHRPPRSSSSLHTVPLHTILHARCHPCNLPCTPSSLHPPLHSILPTHRPPAHHPPCSPSSPHTILPAHCLPSHPPSLTSPSAQVPIPVQCSCCAHISCSPRVLALIWGRVFLLSTLTESSFLSCADTSACCPARLYHLIQTDLL